MTDHHPRDSGGQAWVVALLVHAVAIAGLLLLPIHSTPGADSRSPAATETEIALDLAPISAAVALQPASIAAASIATAESSGVSRSAQGAVPGGVTRASSSSEPTSAAARSGPSGAPSTLLAAESGAVAPSSASPALTGDGRGVVPIPFTASELGIGPHNPFLPRAEEKVPTSGPNTPAARAMRGTGLARDRELGLGPEGPVVRALASATSSSIAPLRGRAVFLVRTGGDGLVSGIDVVDSEGGSGWLDAGRLAFEALRGKKLNVPRGVAGMNMRIEVRSSMTLPSGESAPVTGRLGDNRMPELTIPDVADLGASARRVVHSRVVSTELL